MNIGQDMRKACMKRRARDEELASASMNTFNSVAFELLTRELATNRPTRPTDRPTEFSLLVCQDIYRKFGLS